MRGFGIALSVLALCTLIAAYLTVAKNEGEALVIAVIGIGIAICGLTFVNARKPQAHD